MRINHKMDLTFGFLILSAMVIGFVFVGCGTFQGSNQPWDKPAVSDNSPAYKSPDAASLDQETRP